MIWWNMNLKQNNFLVHYYNNRAYETVNNFSNMYLKNLWEAENEKMILKSFKIYGISNGMDGAEDTE